MDYHSLGKRVLMEFKQYVKDYYDHAFSELIGR